MTRPYNLTHSIRDGGFVKYRSNIPISTALTINIELVLKVEHFIARLNTRRRDCPHTNETTNATYKARRPARRKCSNFEKDRVAYRIRVRRLSGILCQR